MPERTIITYDNGGSMTGRLLFDDLSSEECHAQIESKQLDMERTIDVLQELFYGNILSIDMIIVDKLSNSQYLRGAFALELDYYLQPKDLHYIKSLDETLIIII